MYVPETLMQRPRHADRPDVALPPGPAATIAFRRPDTTLDPRLFVPGRQQAAESPIKIISCIPMAYQAPCKPILMPGEPRCLFVLALGSSGRRLVGLALQRLQR